MSRLLDPLLSLMPLAFDREFQDLDPVAMKDNSRSEWSVGFCEWHRLESLCTTCGPVASQMGYLVLDGVELHMSYWSCTYTGSWRVFHPTANLCPMNGRDGLGYQGVSYAMWNPPQSLVKM